MIITKRIKGLSTQPYIDLGEGLSKSLFFAAITPGAHTIEVCQNNGGPENGTRVGSPWGGAKAFNGSGSAQTMTELNANRYPAFTTLFSWSILFRITDTTVTNSYLTERGGPTDQAAIIYGFVAHTVEFYGGGGFTGTDPRTGSQISVNDTLWHLVTYCYDGVTWAGYLDGIQQFSVSRTFSLNTNSVGPAWYIGGADGGTNVTKAEIAAVYAWNRALAPAENRDLWANPMRVFMPSRLVFVPAVAAPPPFTLPWVDVQMPQLLPQ